MSSRLHDAAAGWDASGDLDFMNDWRVLKIILEWSFTDLNPGHSSSAKKVGQTDQLTIYNLITLHLFSSNTLRKAAAL